MDSGTAALVGSAIGSMTGVATTVLNEYYRNRNVNKLAKIRKTTLIKMLENPKFKFRNLETLSDAIGADENATVALLLEIGARKNRAVGSDQWGLVSRNPWPEDRQAN